METEPQDSPNPPKPRQKGGFHTHKPNCPCRPCLARQRKEEAFARAAGNGLDLESMSPKERRSYENSIAIQADFPPVIARKKDQRSRVLQWLHLRNTEPSLTQKQIAEKMGIAYATLRNLLSRATKQGWLQWEDPISRLDYEIIPKTIENLVGFLDAKDKQVTIEVAKGTLFKSYQEAKGLNTEAPQTILALKIETASTDVPMKISSGRILGTPKQIEEAILVEEE
jgi:transposase